MKACLISDIHGAQGAATDYMDAWAAILAQRAYQVQTVFLDTLCPAAYQARPFDKDETHRHFVNGGIDAAALNLQGMVSSEKFDLLLGFSLGGYLACQARLVLPATAKIICISATRLRLSEALPGECAIHAVFGTDDPWRPQGGLRLGGTQYEYLIADATHDIYLRPDACRFVLDN